MTASLSERDPLSIIWSYNSPPLTLWNNEIILFFHQEKKNTVQELMWGFHVVQRLQEGQQFLDV